MTTNFELLFWIALVVACAGWLLGINMVAFGFCFGVLSNYLAIYGKEQLGITAGTGTYFMLCSVGLIASRIQGGKALRKGLLTENAGQGILLGGIIAEHLGYAAAFWSVALVNAIGSALFFMATKSFFLQRKLQ